MVSFDFSEYFDIHFYLLRIRTSEVLATNQMRRGRWFAIIDRI